MSVTSQAVLVISHASGHCEGSDARGESFGCGGLISSKLMACC